MLPAGRCARCGACESCFLMYPGCGRAIMGPPLRSTSGVSMSGDVLIRWAHDIGNVSQTHIIRMNRVDRMGERVRAVSMNASMRRVHETRERSVHGVLTR